MLDKANHDQRNASAAFNFGEVFSRQSTQAIDNYDNFHQTIMNLEPSQIEDSVCQTWLQATVTNFLILIELQMYTLLVMLTLKAELAVSDVV